MAPQYQGTEATDPPLLVMIQTAFRLAPNWEGKQFYRLIDCNNKVLGVRQR